MFTCICGHCWAQHCFSISPQKLLVITWATHSFETTNWFVAKLGIFYDICYSKCKRKFKLKSNSHTIDVGLSNISTAQTRKLYLFKYRHLVSIIYSHHISCYMRIFPETWWSIRTQINVHARIYAQTGPFTSAIPTTSKRKVFSTCCFGPTSHIHTHTLILFYWARLRNGRKYIMRVVWNYSSIAEHKMPPQIEDSQSRHVKMLLNELHET